MTLQIIMDVEPYQFVAEMGMKLRLDLVGLIEKPDSNVHRARQIIVAACEWRPAAFAECTRHAGVDVDRTSLIWRECHHRAIESCKRRDRRTGYPPTIGAVTVSDGGRGSSCSNSSGSTVASTGNRLRSVVVGHSNLPMDIVTLLKTHSLGNSR